MGFGEIMRRRNFIGLLGSAAAWPFGARAQEPGRIYRIGFLGSGPRDNYFPVFEPLRRAGFIEGQNLIVDWRAFAQRVDKMPELARELVEGKPDVIYASGDLAISALLRATVTIPIVGVTEDMVGSGLVKSLARPDTNLTGVSILSTELDGKRQELLIDALPGIKRLGVLADTRATAAPPLQALHEAARARNVELLVQPVTRSEEIGNAIEAAKESGATALNVLASPVFYAFRRVIMKRVGELHLPAIYQFSEEAKEGGFAAYGPSFVALYGNMVTPKLVGLLRGAKPSDFPVEQPSKFELVVNLKTAKALGVAIPESFLLRADEVIE